MQSYDPSPDSFGDPIFALPPPLFPEDFSGLFANFNFYKKREGTREIEKLSTHFRQNQLIHEIWILIQNSSLPNLPKSKRALRKFNITTLRRLKAELTQAAAARLPNEVAEFLRKGNYLFDLLQEMSPPADTPAASFGVLTTVLRQIHEHFPEKL